MLRGWEALLHGFEPLAHFLKQLFDLFEPLFGRALFITASFCGFFTVLAVSGSSSWFSVRGFLQARDLSFDHRGQFDSEVVALQQSFQRGNGRGIAPTTERQDSGR